MHNPAHSSLTYPLYTSTAQTPTRILRLSESHLYNLLLTGENGLQSSCGPRQCRSVWPGAKGAQSRCPASKNPHRVVAVGTRLQKQLLQGADHLSPAPALLPDTLELISLAPQLLLAALLLAQAGLQPRFELRHTGTQAVLAVQQVLDDKLCQAQHLEQHRVHRLPTVVAHLSVQVTEGDTSNVLLQSGHVQLPGHAVHVHSADAPPVYALTARLELEGRGCVDPG